MARVTSEDFAERLLRSAQQAAAIKKGEMPAPRSSKHKITTREAVVADPPRYDAERIAGLRTRIGVSQPVFARMLGVKPPTVRAWEQQKKEPSGSARRLLEVYERSPELARETLRPAGSAVARGASKPSTSQRRAAG